MTPYELLLGNPPTDEDQIRAAAARLRGSDQRSVLAMLSGDRVLAPIGQEQMRTTQGTARRRMEDEAADGPGRACCSGCRDRC